MSVDISITHLDRSLPSTFIKMAALRRYFVLSKMAPPTFAQVKAAATAAAMAIAYPVAKDSAKFLASNAYSYYKKAHVGRTPAKFNPVGKRSLDSVMRLRGGAPERKRQRFTGKTRYGGYRTMGRYTGKFRKTRKRNVKRKWYGQGCVERIERGGTTSDAQCQYVGCTNTPMTKQLQQIGRCILKELFKQAGVAITDWTRRLDLQDDTAYALDHYYYVDANSNTISSDQISGNINNATDLQTVVDLIVANFESVYGLEVPSYPVRWVMRSKTTGPTLEGPIVATVIADQFNFEVKNYAMMLIQNRTLGNGTDENEMTNITNNPLIGKMYVCNSNGAVPRQRGSNSANGGFMPDQSTGIFDTGHLVDRANLIKPPLPWYWRGVKKTSSVRLEPGAIKRHTVTFNRKYNLNKFLVKYNTAMTSDLKQVFMGSTVMFALEKLLDSRDTEQVISIGYEVNTTLKINYSYKKQVFTNPITLVDTSPI